jgi:hypothetical protein
VLNVGSDLSDSVAYTKLLHALSLTDAAVASRRCATGKCSVFPSFSQSLLNQDPVCAAAEVLERMHRIGVPVALTSPDLIVNGTSDCNLAVTAYLMCTFSQALVHRTPASQQRVDRFVGDDFRWTPGDVDDAVTDCMEVTSPRGKASPTKSPMRSPMRQKMMDAGELSSRGEESLVM